MRITAVCLALLFYSCPEPKPETRRRIIIFEDLTMSLASDETNKAQAIVDEIIEKTPGGTDVVIIPICENTDLAPDKTFTMPFPEGTSAYAEREALAARNQLKKEIHAFIQEVARTNALRREYSSCISPALRRANTVMRVPQGKVQWKTDVIIVSDMVEECRASVLGQPVRLKLAGHQFDEAQRLVGHTQPLPALPGANVFVMIPKAMSTIVEDPTYPKPHQVKDFWERLFARSGVTGDRLWWDIDPAKYCESIRR